MNRVKILHCADIHIGAAESFLKTNADSRRIETLLTFEKIIDSAVESQVDIILIAGDLFDSNTLPDRFVDAVFTKIRNSGIKTVFAAGNHDPLDAESPFLNRDLPENLYVLGTKDECITFEDINLKVYGRSFEGAFLQGKHQFDITPDKDYVNLMVQHGDLCSDLSSDYNAITPTFVKNSGMDYIALGHVHKRSPIGNIGNTYFAYCGCPEGQGFDELDEKGIYIGEIGKGKCELEFVPVSKRQHIHAKIDISGNKDNTEISKVITDYLNTNYGENYGENLYKIELVGAVSPETQISVAEICSRVSQSVYYVKIKDSTEFAIDFETLAKEKSLKGIFVKNMLERENNSPEEEKPIIRKALKLGLKAFLTEVKYNED